MEPLREALHPFAGINRCVAVRITTAFLLVALTGCKADNVHDVPIQEIPTPLPPGQVVIAHGGLSTRVFAMWVTYKGTASQELLALVLWLGDSGWWENQSFEGTSRLEQDSNGPLFAYADVKIGATSLSCSVDLRGRRLFLNNATIPLAARNTVVVTRNASSGTWQVVSSHVVAPMFVGVTFQPDELTQLLRAHTELRGLME